MVSRLLKSIVRSRVSKCKKGKKSIVKEERKKGKGKKEEQEQEEEEKEQERKGNIRKEKSNKSSCCRKTAKRLGQGNNGHTRAKKIWL